jgi:NAD(P)-dependent dehydrogenase (short-subunit alcohol dehydrogenase family)
MGLACAARLVDRVDHLVLVDIDEASVAAAAKELTGQGPASVEPFGLDITDQDGLDRLAARISELGTLRAVAHAAGISPTMADWRRILLVDLVGTARLAEVLRPLSTSGTATVCFASMAARLAFANADPKVDAAVDDPLDPGLFDRVQEAAGASIEDPGAAYSWAKRGVQRFVEREAVRLGPLGARICSVSPGIIDTPMGREEAEAHPIMEQMVSLTPLRREGRPEELASVVAFLLSDEASFVNGTDVLVDGGVGATLREPPPAG